MNAEPFELRAIGYIESALRDLGSAPRQPDEGAPTAVVRLKPEVLEGAKDIAAGDELILLTWLHAADRLTLTVRPRDDATRPMTGVFSTRSADRPNPIGLHQVRVIAVNDGAISVEALEAIDGTPVLDLKPVLSRVFER